MPNSGVEWGHARGRRVIARWLLIALVVAALSSFVVPSAGAAADLLVALTPNTTVTDVFGAAGLLDAPRSLGQPGVYQIVVSDRAQALAALRRNPHVRYAEPDGTVALTAPAELQQATTDTQDHWGLDRVDAAPAWSTSEGAGVTVAVLDTGISMTQPELAGRVLPGFDFVHNRAGAPDDAGHGTFVAGVIAAARNADGTSGVAPDVTVLPVKILDQNGVGSTANFVAGINYAVAQGARVINISAGGIDNSQALDDALSNAEAHGVVVVAATGNDGIESTSYPAAVPTVLAVSATDSQDKVPSFATYGAYVDLAAPGVDIASTWWSTAAGDGRTVASGTSASAPFVAGAAALLLAAHPQLSPSAVRQLLTESAVDIDLPGIDVHSGFGRLDVALAMRDATSNPNPGEAGLAVVAGEQHLTFSAAGFAAGEPVSLLVQDDSGSHLLHGFSADASGALAADLGEATRFSGEAIHIVAVGEQSGTVAAGVQTTVLAAALPAFAPVAPIPSDDNHLYFPETGHTLANGFKTYWEEHGGLAVFGYPISEEFSERNPDTGQSYTVQYFERNRFEYHPELAGTPYEVSLGRLGVQIAPQVFPTTPQPAGSDPGTVYFSQTGHTLSGPFLDYWQQHGGLAIFGYPTSEPFEQNGHLVQYFERNRFELHPENAGTPYLVLLARFGVDLAIQQGYLR